MEKRNYQKNKKVKKNKNYKRFFLTEVGLIHLVISELHSSIIFQIAIIILTIWIIIIKKQIKTRYKRNKFIKLIIKNKNTKLMN